MMTKSQQPLVEQYFADLTKTAGRLPRGQRTELLAEIRSHLDAGVSEATSEADIRNMLDALGPPADIVEAAAPAPSEGQRGPSARLALVLSIVGLLLTPTFVGGVVLGIVAVVVGVQARRSLRAEGESSTVATSAVVIATIAIVIGSIAVIAPLIMVLFLFPVH